jgi:hypothetical protein
MATAHEPLTEWRNRYHLSFGLTAERLTLSYSVFCIYPKQAYVRLNLDKLPLLEMTSVEARAWAAEIIQTADRADQLAKKEAAAYEAALLKAEGHEGFFNRIPDSNGLPPDTQWHFTHGPYL